MRKTTLCAVAMVVGLAGEVRAQTTFTSGASATIPVGGGTGSSAAGPADPYSMSAFSSGMTGVVSDIRVRLNSLVHSRPQDLDIVFCSAGGTCVVLMSDAGGTAPMSATLTFQTGAAAISDMDTPINNSTVGTFDYAPTNDFLPSVGNTGDTVLDVFRGQSPNGLWHLFIYDDLDLGRSTPPFHDGSRGTLASFSVIITTTATPNNRPTLNTALSPTLPSIQEDPGINNGSRFLDLITGISDADPWHVLGIAVTGASAGFQYSEDNGSSWITPTGISPTNALLVPVNLFNRARFNPAPNFNGTESAVFTFRAWDRTAGGDFYNADIATLGTAVSTLDDTVSIQVTPVNDPPFIAVIPDQLQLEDTNHLVGIPVTDIDSVPTLTPSAPANTLIASMSVSAGANPILTVVPVANAVGTVLVTVTASDGALTYARSFNMTFQAVNDAPTVSILADATTNEDTAVNVAFAAGDVDTAESSLVITVVPVDTTLFPPGSVTVTGSTGAFTARFIPAVNRNGSSSFTITVSDGQFNAQATRTVTVTPVNDAPAISVNPTATAVEDTELGPVTFTVSDVDDALSSLTVTGAIVGHGTVMTSGTDGTRSFTYLPGANLITASTITLTVRDSGNATASANVAVTVTPVNDPPVFAPLGPQFMTEDGTLDVQFTVTDVDSTVTTLVFSSSSNNPALVDSTGLMINGTTTPGSLRITPKANEAGNTIITLTALDDSVMGSTTFDLTVSSVDDPPSITAPADTTFPAGQSVTLNFTVADIDSPTGPLTLTSRTTNNTLFPAGSITFGGADDLRTVTLTPAGTLDGDAVITLVFQDGMDAGPGNSATFNVSVLEASSSSSGGSGPVSSGSNSSTQGGSSGMVASSAGGSSAAGSTSTAGSSGPGPSSAGGSSTGAGSSSVMTASSEMPSSGATSTGGGDDGGDNNRGCNSLTVLGGSLPFPALLLGLVLVLLRRRRV